MAEESVLNITLHVYDEEIAMKLHNREDEEYYRAAAKLITERYGAYAQVYRGRKSDHTIALMTLIEIALRFEKEKAKKAPKRRPRPHRKTEGGTANSK